MNKKRKLVERAIGLVLGLILAFTIAGKLSPKSDPVEASEEKTEVVIKDEKINSNYDDKEVDDQGNRIGATNNKPKKDKDDNVEKIKGFFLNDDETITVHYLDVGQGSAAFIELGDKSMIVDTGNIGDGEFISNYIKGRGYDRIDYLIATHPHADHVGGMADILYKLDVDTVVMPRIKESLIPTTKVYERTLEVLIENNTRVIEPRVGQVIIDEDGYKATLLNDHEEADNLNDYSVAVKVEYKGVSYFFGGDLEKKGESNLVDNYNGDMEVDVYLANHHGSNTSSTDMLMERLQPDYIVIQSGENNRYGHPHKEVIYKFNRQEIPIYRNDESGNIISYSNGHKIKFIKER